MYHSFDRVEKVVDIETNRAPRYQFNLHRSQFIGDSYRRGVDGVCGRVESLCGGRYVTNISISSDWAAAAIFISAAAALFISMRWRRAFARSAFLAEFSAIFLLAERNGGRLARDYYCRYTEKLGDKLSPITIVMIYTF